MYTLLTTLVAVAIFQAPAQPPAAAAPAVPATAERIAAAILAAPAESRADATVRGVDGSGTLQTLRQGTNEIVCLADDPRDPAFSVACYHQDLEPFMTRGRELTAKGVTGQEREDIRWKEIEAGTLKMSREPRTLSVVTGDGFDAASGTIANAYTRWVVYLPFATGESTGISTTPVPGGPWLMFPGKAGAHVMINPLRDRR
jgi:hypothetical protein